MSLIYTLALSFQCVIHTTVTQSSNHALWELVLGLEENLLRFLCVMNRVSVFYVVHLDG